jgi:uncharacterized membrane protein
MIARMDSVSFLSGIFGFILGILLLFVSIVWIIFPFIVMSRMRMIREKIEEGNRSTHALIQELAKGNQFLSKIAASTAPKAAPPSPKSETSKLNISKGGEDLGRMDIHSVKTMLKRGELTLQDHYFDAVLNEWMTLDFHPDFC